MTDRTMCWTHIDLCNHVSNSDPQRLIDITTTCWTCIDCDRCQYWFSSSATMSPFLPTEITCINWFLTNAMKIFLPCFEPIAFWLKIYQFDSKSVVGLAFNVFVVVATIVNKGWLSWFLHIFEGWFLFFTWLQQKFLSDHCCWSTTITWLQQICLWLQSYGRHHQLITLNICWKQIHGWLQLDVCYHLFVCYFPPTPLSTMIIGPFFTSTL